MSVELGWKVKDKVTGFTGVVTAVTLFLNGCRRVCIQPAVGKDGKMPSDGWFDEPQLDRVGRTAIKSDRIRKAGGPLPTSIPTRRN